MAQRLALLGAKPGDAVDLAVAENPLDLALVRGSLTKEQHGAAQLFIRLYRGIKMPTIKGSRDPSDFASETPSPVDQLFSPTVKDGVSLPIDGDLTGLRRTDHAQ